MPIQIRGVYLIRSRTHQIARKRLSKMVMRGVHLHLFFWRRLSTTVILSNLSKI